MDPLSLLGRAVVVFLLLGLTLWLLRRSDGLKKLRRTGTPLEVLGSARLGKGASVALVRIGDADYALGVTDQAVSLLTEAELDSEDSGAAAAAEARPERPSFPAALQAQLGLLTRRGHGSRLPAPQEESTASAVATTAAPEQVDAGNETADEAQAAEIAPAGRAPRGGDPDLFAGLLAATARSPLAHPDRRTGARATRAPRTAAPAQRLTGTGQRRASRRGGGGADGATTVPDAA